LIKKIEDDDIRDFVLLGLSAVLVTLLGE
jgi:hypothetical protein